MNVYVLVTIRLSTYLHTYAHTLLHFLIFMYTVLSVLSLSHSTVILNICMILYMLLHYSPLPFHICIHICHAQYMLYTCTYLRTPLYSLTPYLQVPGSPLCINCYPKQSEIYLNKLYDVNTHQTVYNSLWTECQRCQGSFHQDVICSNKVGIYYVYCIPV